MKIGDADRHVRDPGLLEVGAPNTTSQSLPSSESAPPLFFFSFYNLFKIGGSKEVDGLAECRSCWRSDMSKVKRGSRKKAREVGDVEEKCVEEVNVEGESIGGDVEVARIGGSKWLARPSQQEAMSIYTRIPTKSTHLVSKSRSKVAGTKRERRRGRGRWLRVNDPARPRVFIHLGARRSGIVDVWYITCIGVN